MPQLDDSAHNQIINLVYDRMYKNFIKELFKGSQKENRRESKHKRDKQPKSRHSLTKEQFLYQMDDGTQISKFLLESAFLRELYLYEMATTIAMMRENMLGDGLSGGSSG